METLKPPPPPLAGGPPVSAENHLPRSISGDPPVDCGENPTVPYRVGDLVWAKSKNSPLWWPGKVLDNSEGPQISIEFFGGAGVDRVELYEVSKFEDEFERMRRISSSKKFLEAVDEALSEVEKELELGFSCNCFGDGSRVGENRLSLFSSTEMLGCLLRAGRDFLCVDELDVVKLKSWMVGYYRGNLREVAEFEEEDDERNVAARGSVNESQGEECEDVRNKVDMKFRIGVELDQWRKERSIAELIADKNSEMKDNECSVERFSGLELLSLISSKKKKRKGGQSTKLEPKSCKHEGLPKYAVELERKEQLTAPLSHEEKKKGVHDAMGENQGSNTRERRKSRYLSPPYTHIGRSAKKIVLPNVELNSVLINGDDMAETSAHAALLASLGSSEMHVKEHVEDTEDLESDLISAKVMLALFLGAAVDPLYLKWTRPFKIIRTFLCEFRKSICTEPSDFDSQNTFIGDLARANTKLKRKSVSDQYKTESSIVQGKRKAGVDAEISMDLDGNSIVQTGNCEVPMRLERERSKADSTTPAEHYGTNGLGNAEVRQMDTGEFCNVSAAKVDDTSIEFPVSMTINALRRRKKGKGVANGENLAVNVDKLIDFNQNNVERKKHRNHGPDGESAFKLNNEAPNGCKGANSSLKRKKRRRYNDEKSAQLVLTFAPGSTLPSKEELISMHSVYGPIVESLTKLTENPPRAYVFFKRKTDAEKANRSLYEQKSSVPSVCDCKLEYKSRYVCAPLTKCSAADTPLPYIKKNLDRMISKLEGFTSAEKTTCQLSPEIRDNLIGDMGSLLQKVNKLMVKHST